ncbi:unnamed protein product [Peniophora sp. CBMAI 1063]|nr:unnamed protein product [Peniophora sp. CBMAI 1063]
MPTSATLPKTNSGFFVYGIKSMHRAFRASSAPSTPTRTTEAKPKQSSSSFLRTITNVGVQVLLPRPALPKPPVSKDAAIISTSTKSSARITKAPIAPKPEPFARKPLPSFKTPSPPRKVPVLRMTPTSGARKTCPTIVPTCSPARAPILRRAIRSPSPRKSVRWEMDSTCSSSPSPVFDSAPVSPVSTAPSTPEPRHRPVINVVGTSRSCKKAQSPPIVSTKAAMAKVATKVPQVATSPKKMKTKSSVNKENVMPRVITAQGPAKRELVIAEQGSQSSVAHTALVQDLTWALQKPQTVIVTENTPFGPRRVRRVVVPDYTGSPASADPNIQREITALRTQARVAAPSGVEHGVTEQGVSLRALEIINRVRRERGQEPLKTVPRNMVATRA